MSSLVIDKMTSSSVIDKMMSSSVIKIMTPVTDKKNNVIRQYPTFMSSVVNKVVNKMSNGKFPYSFSVQYEKICWLKSVYIIKR